jgi:enoyl-CoA hydratase
VPAAEVLATALAVAEKIASFSLPSVMQAKAAVAAAYAQPLAEGIKSEQRLFHALFATEDQKEGMAAFAEKRPPAFRNR